MQNQLGQQQSQEPVYIRVAQATKLFGIGKTTLYALIQKRKIRSLSLRERGAQKGIRLIDFHSLRKFLDSQADGGPVELPEDEALPAHKSCVISSGHEETE
jgi:excisionase family DNA binding protein